MGCFNSLPSQGVAFLGMLQDLGRDQSLHHCPLPTPHGRGRLGGSSIMALCTYFGHPCGLLSCHLSHCHPCHGGLLSCPLGGQRLVSFHHCSRDELNDCLVREVIQHLNV